MSQQINLLDASLLPPKDWCTGVRIVALGAVLTIALAAQFAHEHWAMKRVLALAPAPAADTPETLTDDAVTPQVERNRALLAAVEGLSDLPRDTAERLTTLTRALPQSVWLHEVMFSGTRGVRITGGTLEPQALAALSQRLGATEAFRDQPLRLFSLAPLPEEEHKDEAVRAPALYGFVLSSVDDTAVNTTASAGTP